MRARGRMENIMTTDEEVMEWLLNNSNQNEAEINSLIDMLHGIIARGEIAEEVGNILDVPADDDGNVYYGTVYFEDQTNVKWLIDWFNEGLTLYNKHVDIMNQLVASYNKMLDIINSWG